VASKVWWLGSFRPQGLKQLEEEENSKLKRIVADLSMDKAMLQDVLSKSFKAFMQA
jgi:putative transposase